MSAVVDGPCGPWITATEATGPDAWQFPTGTEVDVVDGWVAVASEILWRLSARQFPGVCEGSHRPAPCQGRALRLPRPVRSIVSVTVDGAALVEGTDWRLDDDDRSILWRIDAAWPSVQRYDLPLTEENAWGVTYRWGAAPPLSGQRAASRLAVELWRAAVPSEESCLPERIQQLTREGISMAIVDPFDFMEKGRTGLYEVDLFLRAVNPTGAEDTGRAVDPLLSSRRRHACC